jgi:sugar O-acyltransferase (sialic acid O-acetyltransferase NeuD family)
MSRRDVVILGTAGTCIDILDAIEAATRAGASDLRCVGFLDDAAHLDGRSIEGLPVLGPLSSARSLNRCLFVNGIGSPRSFLAKQRIIELTGVEIDRFVSVVHPSASVSMRAVVGRGSVILQNVTLTARARVGDHVVVLPNSVVSHDSTIGDYSCLAGGVVVSGTVHIGESCYIGAGACIRDGITIGARTLVGMGSVVISDLPQNSVAYGVPARCS